MVSQDGFIYRYDLVNLKLKGDGAIDRGCDFRSCIFIEDLKDEFRLMTVGTENSRALCRVYNKNEDVELNSHDEVPLSEPGALLLKRFSVICHVKSLSQAVPFENFLVGTENGLIQTLSSNFATFGVPMD